MIEVMPLQPIGSDQRGATYVFDNDRVGQFILIHRVAGSVSGSEYHSGLHPYKSPECLIVAQGCGRLEWADMNSTAHGECWLQGPVQVNIPAMVWHRVIAETDMVILEMNAIAHCSGDTVKLFEHPNKPEKDA